MYHSMYAHVAGPNLINSKETVMICINYRVQQQNVCMYIYVYLCMYVHVAGGKCSYYSRTRNRIIHSKNIYCKTIIVYSGEQLLYSPIYVIQFLLA